MYARYALDFFGFENTILGVWLNQQIFSSIRGDIILAQIGDCNDKLNPCSSEGLPTRVGWIKRVIDALKLFIERLANWYPAAFLFFTRVSAMKYDTVDDKACGGCNLYTNIFVFSNKSCKYREFGSGTCLDCKVWYFTFYFFEEFLKKH